MLPRRLFYIQALQVAGSCASRKVLPWYRHLFTFLLRSQIMLGFSPPNGHVYTHHTISDLAQNFHTCLYPKSKTLCKFSAPQSAGNAWKHHFKLKAQFKFFEKFKNENLKMWSDRLKFNQKKYPKIHFRCKISRRIQPSGQNFPTIYGTFRNLGKPGKVQPGRKLKIAVAKKPRRFETLSTSQKLGFCKHFKIVMVAYVLFSTPERVKPEKPKKNQFFR